MDESRESNLRILDWVESIGGEYVWEAEVFAISLEEVEIGDDQARRLGELAGVQQIALRADRLSLGTLLALASIEGLRSLVLFGATLTEEERGELARSINEVRWLELPASRD